MVLLKLSKLSMIYSLLLMSLLIQTTARRSDMLASDVIETPLKNDNKINTLSNSYIYPSITNDAPIEPLLENILSIPTNNTKNDGEASFENDTSDTAERNDNNRRDDRSSVIFNNAHITKETNEDNTSGATNTYETNDSLPTDSSIDNNDAYPLTKGDKNNFLAPIEANKNLIFASNDLSVTRDNQNDALITNDNNENDQGTTSVFNQPSTSNALEPISPSTTPSNGMPEKTFSNYEPKHIGISPAIEDVVDDNDYNSKSTSSKTNPTFVPSNYEAEYDVSTEFAAEIDAYVAEAEDRENKSGEITAVFGCVCLVVLGGFLYVKKKKHDTMELQYKHLNKRDEN